MTSIPSDLGRRFVAREATVGIVGMGYVGLPLMLAATAAGFRVIGFDIDLARIEGLNAGRSPLGHIGDARVGAARATGRFEATADLARSAAADAVLICVPTPLGDHREPDLRYVEGTARALAPICAGASSSSSNPPPGPAPRRR
jgi:UDP-N-acetyl-D-glucosamine dehydrogenase